ncbi:MAG: LytR C-terminal domain-containing protein [Patescibacteria group bacterium]
MPKDKSAKSESKKVVVVEEVEATVETPIVESKPEPEVKTETEVFVEEEKSSYLWIIIPTALLVGALVGGLITYFSGISRLSKEDQTLAPSATVEPAIEPTPTASPSSSLKREQIKLQVLNGSGISGFAGKAKTYLEGLGYKDVMTGNAKTSDFTNTVISVKDSKKELLETIKTDLSKNYQVTEKTETLPASSKYDFVITLGSK